VASPRGLSLALAIKMSSLSKGVKSAAKIVAVLLAPIFVICGWVQWDIHRVKSFCQDVYVGASLATLPQLADEHLISRHEIRQGIYDEQSKDWVFSVGAVAIKEEMACSIHHNKVSVISVKFYGD